MMKLIRNGGARSIARYQLIREFNCHFFNEEFYRSHQPSSFLLQYEDNREIQDSYLQDVLDLCMHTDVCKQLGISLMDLMNMDYPTYMFIRDAMTKDKQERIKEQERSTKAFKERADSFLGVKNGPKR